MAKSFTLEEYFNKHNGRTYLIRLGNSKSNCKAVVTICGYVKDDNYHLIGKLKSKQGLYPHFTDVKDWHYIENHNISNEYVFVNIASIEKYPNVKTIVKRNSRENNIDDINEIEFQKLEIGNQKKVNNQINTNH